MIKVRGGGCRPGEGSPEALMALTNLASNNQGAVFDVFWLRRLLAEQTREFRAGSDRISRHSERLEPPGTHGLVFYFCLGLTSARVRLSHDEEETLCNYLFSFGFTLWVTDGYDKIQTSLYLERGKCATEAIYAVVLFEIFHQIDWVWPTLRWTPLYLVAFSHIRWYNEQNFVIGPKSVQL